MERIITPPWELNGYGYIILYRFDRDFVREAGRVPDVLMENYRISIGAVMLVDYTKSPVGPYRELLFIPGRFQVGRRRYYHISKIYVSTQASLENGQENWGIPKELADFTVEDDPDDVRVKRWTVAKDGTAFLRATTQAGLLRLPVNSILNPFPTTLVHARERDGALLTVDPYGGGTMSFAASLLDIEVDGAHFPDVSDEKPLGVLESVNFHMTFPPPGLVE